MLENDVVRRQWVVRLARERALGVASASVARSLVAGLAMAFALAACPAPGPLATSAPAATPTPTHEVGARLIHDELRRIESGMLLSGEPDAPIDVDDRVRLVLAPPAGSVTVAGVPLCDVTSTELCLVATLAVPVVIPVTLSVSWSVVGEEEHTQETPGGTYRLRRATDQLSGSFLFKPVIVDAGDWPWGDLPADTHTIRITVRVAADISRASPALRGGQPVVYERSRDVTVETPRIGLPLTLVMFIDPNFGTPANAGAYVLIRGQGQLACDVLNEQLQLVQRAGKTLNTFVAMADFLLGLQRIDSAVRAPRTACRTAFSVPNLFVDPLDPGGFIGWGHVTAEDSMSSLVLIGSEGAVAQLFNDRGWGAHSQSTGLFEHNPTGGFFTLTVGPELIVSIPNLLPSAITHNPTTDPVVAPQSAYVCGSEPRSRHGAFGVDSFNDEISSAFFPTSTRTITLRPTTVDACGS